MAEFPTLSSVGMVVTAGVITKSLRHEEANVENVVYILVSFLNSMFHRLKNFHIDGIS